MIERAYLIVTVFVIVFPQIPHPSSTPAVIVYVPAGVLERSQITSGPVPIILPAETVY